MAFGCAVFLGVPALNAQPAVPPVPIAQAGGERADTADSDVYVNDSFEAADALAKANALGERGEWAEAARLLQRASDTSRDRLVRLGSGCYTGARERINDAIANWPRRGLEAYRELFEREAEHALTRSFASRRLADLVDLFDRYFCTASAAKLADRIGQRALEAGDLALAEYAYHRVRDRHPDRAEFESRDRAMLALISAMRGKGPDDAAQRSLPEMTLRWAGQDRPLREVLDEVRASFHTHDGAWSPTDWPMFGGDPLRNREAVTDVDEPGLLWRFDLIDHPQGSADGEEIEVTLGGDDGKGRYLTMQPVAAGDLVFVQLMRDVVALNRRSGALAWRFTAGERAGGGAVVLDEQGPGWDSATVHDGRVYAVISGDPVPYYSYESSRTPSELVCLDAATGRLVWRLDQEAINEQFAEINFDSSPVVEHGRLLVVGRRRRSFGFEDCFLYCFDAATGALRYRTHLGSASTGTFGSRQATKSVAALDGENAYVCSNLGTVAAVSVHTGSVKWLRLYDRRRTDGGAARSVRDIRSWQFNPPLVSGGRLVVLPTDASDLMVIAASDGELRRTVAAEEIAGIETLLSVSGDVVCGVGAKAACYDLNNEKLLWSSPLPEEEIAFGRGVRTAERLLIPTKRLLCAFRLDDGSRTDQPWEAEGEGGNLFALPDQLLVAGAGRLSAYVRKKEIWKSLHDRMAAAPADPGPALELAEVALNNGEFVEALLVLGDAVARADAREEPRDPAVRKRVFDDALMFVDRLGARNLLDEARLETLHGYAARYAPDAPSAVRYRLRFAEAFAATDRADEAVRLYQQILRDRSLRELPANPANEKPTAAAVVAQDRITTLFASKGRAIYERYDAEARQWLARDRAAGDLAGLQRVVETFPNSTAAPLALIAQGELLASAGKAKDASRRFAQAYHYYPDQVDRPDLLRRIADAYGSTGASERAWSWLTKAAREHPSVRILDGGRPVTFLEYRERFSAVRDRVEPSRPDTAPPLSGSFTVELDDTASLLVPRFGDEPTSRWSRFFVQAPEGIRAFDARTGREAWAQAATVRRRAELLLATPTLALFTTPYEVLALDASTGSRRWTHGEYPARAENVDADWEDTNIFRHYAVHGSRMVIARDGGQMDCLDLNTGQVVWSQTRKPAPAGPLRVSDALVVYHIVQDQMPVVCLVDAATGAWIDAIMIDEKRTIEDLFITLDDQIIAATTGGVSAFDAETRRLRWQITVPGQVRRESLAIDVDALYLSDDGRRVRKTSLEDGTTVWESEPLVPRSDDDLSVMLQDASVLIGSSSTISGVDAINGLTLWRGTTLDEPHLTARMLTRAYALAIDQPREPGDAIATAFFYDHRNGSGTIARDGGALALGSLGDIRAAIALDGSLVIQTGSTIRGWTKP